MASKQGLATTRWWDRHQTSEGPNASLDWASTVTHRWGGELCSQARTHALAACRSGAKLATAVRRFQRPVCYQDVPAAALPAALQDENVLGIPRRIDGRMTYDALDNLKSWKLAGA